SAQLPSIRSGDNPPALAWVTVRVSTFFQVGWRMQLGMIGLGRMGTNMARRLLKGGHTCVVFSRSGPAVAEQGCWRHFAGRTRRQPSAIWLMVPVGVIEKVKVIVDLLPHFYQ